MKKLFSILTGVVILAVIIVACKDKFNESDFLTLQAKLKTQADTAKLNQQIRELNQAGALLSFTVQVVEDRTPLQGVDVQVSNDVTSGSVKVTTDANGNAVFNKASVGSNTILVSKSGYIAASAVVDFGTLSAGTYYTTVTGANGATNIVPLKQSKSVILPIFATGGTGSTGTIMGRVTIENDLTNTAPEVPANLTLKANFANAIPAQVQGTGVSVLSYNFNQANFGTATVNNTTGLYSMVVPATAAGLNIQLIIPEIDGTLKMAANTVDNQPANGQPAPQAMPMAIINQATLWGPNVYNNSGYDGGFPNVSGAKIVFPTAPLAGAGLNLSFAALARPLSVDKYSNGGNVAYTWDTYNWGINEADPNSFDVGETSYQLLTRGAGYTSSPTINITGGGGTGAHMNASIRGTVTGINIATGGVGYPNSGTVNLDIYFKDNGAVPSDHYLFSLNNCSFSATAGAITAITLPATGNNTYGIDSSNPWRTIDAGSVGYLVGSGNWTVVVNGGGGSTPATATAAVSGEVDHIQLDKYGSGYTGIPSIAFTLGGGSTQATMTANEFRTQWSVALDNSGKTVDYVVPPQNIQWGIDGYNAGQYLSNSVWDNLNNNPNFNSVIKAANKVVAQIDQLASYRTWDYFSKKPTAVITPSLSVTTVASVSVNANGTINFVSFPFNGQTVNNVPAFGRGYSSLIQATNGTVQPMFSGIGGSGGAIDLTNFNCNSCYEYGEYTLSNGNIAGSNTNFFLTPGAGYLQNVNQQGFVAFSAVNNGSVNVKTGDIQIVDIKYGTGKRKNVVN